MPDLIPKLTPELILKLTPDLIPKLISDPIPELIPNLIIEEMIQILVLYFNRLHISLIDWTSARSYLFAPNLALVRNKNSAVRLLAMGPESVLPLKLSLSYNPLTFFNTQKLMRNLTSMKDTHIHIKPNCFFVTNIIITRPLHKHIWNIMAIVIV